MEPPLSSPSSILFLKIPFLFTILAFIIFITTFIYGEDFSCFFSQLGPNSCNPSDQQIPISEIVNNGKSLPFAIGVTKYGCDLFSGKWVRDNSSLPLYKESDCPYIKPQLTCQKNGRPDMDYLYWRWQPHGCIFPSFNATLMLETLRGKRMMFVGDSLIRGQFVSMVCLLHSIIPKGLSSMETFGLQHVFTAKPYNATIQFYWAPFLLESNSDDRGIHRVSESDRMVRKGSINKHGQNWKGADILVFNTYVWWVTTKKFKILQAGSFNDEKKEIVEVLSEDAYRMGLKTMLGWIKKNMDPKETRVFFIGISPPHNKSIDWGGNPNGNCYNETTIIEDANYWGSDTSKSIMQIIGEEIKSNYDDVPVTFLNITQLSNYRKDAHTSIYKKHWIPPTPEQLANPVSYADCLHWCLPGLQDTWNQLLFTKIFYP